MQNRKYHTKNTRVTTGRGTDLAGPVDIKITESVRSGFLWIVLTL